MTFVEYLYVACTYLVIAFLAKFVWSKRKLLKNIIITIPRDFRITYALVVKSLSRWILCRMKNQTVFKGFDKIVQRTPNRTCFFFKEEKWTYRQVQMMSFQVANFFQAQGFRKGDVIGVVMNNRPELVCIWLGLSRLGVITALINHNLRGDSLNHTVTTSKCKAVIFGSETHEVIKEAWEERQASAEPQTEVQLYELDRFLDVLIPLSHKSSFPVFNISSNSFSRGTFKPNDLVSCLRTASAKPVVISKKCEEPHFLEPFLYIFTSGTTGMPKAAKYSHSKCTTLSTVFYVIGGNEHDILFCPLPLHHTFALASVVMALTFGLPLVIVEKFSASRFWSDMQFYKCTICMYMGELCRFIVNQPPQPELERNHSLRIMYGSGVKPEVWEEFVNRFNVKKVMEVYGSTEGNCTMINQEGTKVGAMGYVPILLQNIYALKIIKVDEITGEVIRDERTGLAIRCDNHEPGELVGKITNLIPSLRYEGYTNAEASEKKIARNVFSHGDRYFRSGDIVTRDELGYYYFKDRIGDTFRWKGENVSTAEVEGLIIRLCEMRTTAVYGVKIPGTEGRAGMAAISDPDKSLDLKRLCAGINKSLPAYARPIFVRCIQEENRLNMTDTFKLQKFNLQKEGFDIENISDPIFIYDSMSSSYQRLELARFKIIMQGSYRF